MDQGPKERKKEERGKKKEGRRLAAREALVASCTITADRIQPPRRKRERSGACRPQSANA